MTTSRADFPKRATLIDELTRPNHCYLEESDKCAFIGEYTSRAGYQHSATNDLILNLKKDMNLRGTPQWPYKAQAISQAALAIRGVFSDDEYLSTLTLVPIPPSKARHDPAYDDRMTNVLRRIRPSPPLDVRELIVQTDNMKPAHDSEVRPSPDEIQAGYVLSEEITEPAPQRLVVVDDVLTNGAHFKAAQRILETRFPGVPVYGLFVARRVVPDVTEESDDIPL